MSSNAIFIGTAGMRLQSQKVSVLGNNIANSTSIAYKAGGMSFIDTYRGFTGQFANGNVKNVGNGIKVGNLFSDWNSGAVKETGQAGNLAFNGDGFFHVQGSDGGNYYTRAGEFSLVEVGATGTYTLMRPDGSQLMGSDGAAPPAVPATALMVFTDFPASWAIASNGAVTAVDGTGALITVNNPIVSAAVFSNMDGLVREDNGLYSDITGTAGITLGVPEDARGVGGIVQGALEMSNVDLVNEFTDLVLTQRAYSANSKTITTASDMLQEVLNLKR